MPNYFGLCLVLLVVNFLFISLLLTEHHYFIKQINNCINLPGHIMKRLKMYTLFQKNNPFDYVLYLCQTVADFHRPVMRKKSNKILIKVPTAL